MPFGAGSARNTGADSWVRRGPTFRLEYPTPLARPMFSPRSGSDQKPCGCLTHVSQVLSIGDDSHPRLSFKSSNRVSLGRASDWVYEQRSAHIEGGGPSSQRRSEL